MRSRRIEAKEEVSQLKENFFVHHNWPLLLDVKKVKGRYSETIVMSLSEALAVPFTYFVF